MSKLARRYEYEIAGKSPNRSDLPSTALTNEARALQVTDRMLKQLARELLLAQSSDWAFLMKTATAREYATKRTIDHLARFNRLHDQCVAGDVDDEFLRDCEWRDNIFPNLNWRYYA
jgi:1,4-alpha-glucan branching enzyme